MAKQSPKQRSKAFVPVKGGGPRADQLWSHLLERRGFGLNHFLLQPPHTQNELANDESAPAYAEKCLQHAKEAAATLHVDSDELLGIFVSQHLKTALTSSRDAEPKTRSDYALRAGRFVWALLRVLDTSQVRVGTNRVFHAKEADKHFQAVYAAANARFQRLQHLERLPPGEAVEPQDAAEHSARLSQALAPYASQIERLVGRRK